MMQHKSLDKEYIFIFGSGRISLARRNQPLLSCTNWRIYSRNLYTYLTTPASFASSTLTTAVTFTIFRTAVYSVEAFTQNAITII